MSAWRTLDTRVIYSNQRFSVEEDRVELPNGNVTTFTVVKADLPTMNCIGVVPFLDNRRILLVKQYRYRYKFFSWEIPTGVVEAQETVEDAAQRELREETGYSAGKLTHLATYHPNMSVVQTAHLFIGEDLERCEPISAGCGESEFIVEVRGCDIDEALGMVLSGRIRDSLSMIGILCANLRLSTRK
ncbi:MAG: NUDIX hydrolase [Candidatus Bathyarchaeia archaeon]